MNRRIILITFGAAVLLLGLWFLFLWSPQGKKLSEAEKRTEVSEAENSTLELRLARLKAAQKDAPELMAKGEQLRRAIPESPELAQFILDANDAASAAGVDFLSISPTPPAPGLGGGPAEVHLSIAITGAYFEVLDYLDRVDDLPRLVVVDSLGLTPGGDNPASGLDQMSVSISARMFTTAVPPSAAGAPGTPGAGGTTTTTTPGGSSTSSSVPAANEPATTSTSTAPQITVSPNNG